MNMRLIREEKMESRRSREGIRTVANRQESRKREGK